MLAFRYVTLAIDFRHYALRHAAAATLFLSCFSFAAADAAATPFFTPCRLP